MESLLDVDRDISTVFTANLQQEMRLTDSIIIITIIIIIIINIVAVVVVIIIIIIIILCMKSYSC